MKSFRIWILVMLISSCSHAQEQNPEQKSESKVLIVYLSRTNNTKALAEIIQENMGGELVALELVNPYPEHYQTTVDQVAEENRSGFLPPLKNIIADFEKYNIVYVGFPTWGMQLPPPMKSFLSQYDFKGKTVIPFNTNAGYGIGNSFETVKNLCPESIVLKGFSTTGRKEREGVLFVMDGDKEVEVRKKVKNWLVEIKIYQP